MSIDSFYKSLKILTGLFFLWYVAFRAINLSVTFDEAQSFLQLSGDTLWEILSYKLPTANNHVLNSIFLMLLRGWAAQSEFVLRLPAVLSFVLYMVYAGKISGLFPNRIVGLSVFVMLISNPYMLDFFSLARGYGLALGFMLPAMYYLLRWVSEGKIQLLIRTLIFGCLSVLSNLVWLNFYMAIVGVIVLHLVTSKNKFRPGKNIIIVLSFTIALLAYIIPVGILLRNLNELYFGGKIGFYHDTITSLLKNSMPEKLHFMSVPVLIIFSCVLVIGIIISIYRKKLSPFVIVTSVLILAALFVIGQHIILNTPYPIDRTALMFIPLATIAFSIGLNEMAGKYHKILKSLFIIFAFIALVNFGFYFNLDHCKEWQYDQNTKRMLSDLREHQNSQEIDYPQSLNIYWIYYPASDYYYRQGKFKYLKKILPTDFGPGFDYYYIYKDIYNKFDLIPHEVIKYYPETETYLIKSRESGIRNYMKKSVNEVLTIPINGFGKGIEFDIDSGFGTNVRLEITSEAWFPKEPKGGEIVASLTNERDSIIEWKSNTMKWGFYGPREWNTANLEINFFNVQPGWKVKTYIWNTGASELKCKDFKAQFYPISDRWVKIFNIKS